MKKNLIEAEKSLRMKFGVSERGLGGEKTQSSHERSRKMRSEIVLNEYIEA